MNQGEVWKAIEAAEANVGGRTKLAAVLGIDRKTVRRWVMAGSVPEHRQDALRILAKQPEPRNALVVLPKPLLVRELGEERLVSHHDIAQRMGIRGIDFKRVIDKCAKQNPHFGEPEMFEEPMPHSRCNLAQLAGHEETRTHVLLNEFQAITAVLSSKSPKRFDLQKEVIDVYLAVKNGEIQTLTARLELQQKYIAKAAAQKLKPPKPAGTPPGWSEPKAIGAATALFRACQGYSLYVYGNGSWRAQTHAAPDEKSTCLASGKTPSILAAVQVADAWQAQYEAT